MTDETEQHEWQQVVDSYEQITSQVKELVLSTDAKERLEALEQLIGQRAACMTRLQEMPSEHLEHPEIRQKLMTIQAMEARVEQGLQVVRQAMQTKMQSLQQQKQVLNGYRPYSGGVAAFIDSRK